MASALVFNNQQNGENFFSKFDRGSLVYYPPRKNSNGGHSVSFKYTANGTPETLYFQTPRCKIPFGISKYNRDDGSPANLSVQLSLPVHAPEFEEFVDAMDDNHKDKACKEAGEWFKARPSSEVIRHLYKPSVIYPTDSQYRPTVRIKINKASKFYNEDKELITPDDIQPGAEMICLVEVSTLWFINDGFKPSFQLIQAKVFESGETQKFQDYAIDDAIDDENNGKRQRAE